MNWNELIEAAGLLFVLVNPFLLSIYLLGLIRRLNRKTFQSVLIRGSLIATAVFIAFSWMGDRVFNDVLHVRFAAFLIFGGVVFLLIALRFVFHGPESISEIRGDAKHLAGSVAMPFLIGPGTVSASILVGARLPMLPAALAIVLAMTAAIGSLLAFKVLHDWVSVRRVDLVERYVEVVGRLVALLIGSIAVEMLLQGVEKWWQSLAP
ncbi:MAG: MarC family protein [Acidobacteriota bacterium]|nr:MarC family protein [Acidobacteriota bacterium]